MNTEKTMYSISIAKPGEKGEFANGEVADFLFTHLDEYGDKREDILKCIEYAASEDKGKGGLIVTAARDGEIKGAVITNHTGMEGYIPSNILVYIAVHGSERGQGLGKKLLKAVIDHTSGGVALHVEPQNPAKFLYEKLGFTNKYLEMRLDQSK